MPPALTLQIAETVEFKSSSNFYFALPHFYFYFEKKNPLIAVLLNFSVGFSPKFSRTYISARWDTFHICAHCVVFRVILLPLFFQTITTSSLLPFYCFFGPISLELYAKIEIHFYFDKFYHFGIVETRHSLALSLDCTF